MLVALCGNVQRLSAPLRQLTSRLSLHTQRIIVEKCAFRSTTYFTLVTPLRNAGTKRLFEVKPSDFLNARALDTLHFYTMLGLVPCLVLVFLVNVFVGPAELTDIPEGYEPRYWEYHKHPISRFMAKYMSPHPQKVYESFLGQLEDIREQKELIFEDRWLRSSDRAHGDYRGWYFIPANPAGVNRARKELELDQEMGELVSR